jgi:hypothetical protein
MNRTVVIGGVVAVAVLLGVAAWLLIGGRSNFSSSQQLAGENAGPTILNPVDVVTEHGVKQSDDGRTLSITFPKFELDTKGGETKSAVFSTNWRLKLGPDERALVAVASFDGYMKSAAVPAPAAAPVPEAAKPATPEAPAATPATPPADGATPAAVPPATTAPAKPETPPPAKPAAGDGVAHVIVTFGSDTTVTEWTDATGTGADHKFSKAAAFVGAPSDLRDGATVPVTVTVELSGATSADTLARLKGIELRLFAENVPKPVEPAASQPATPATTDAAPAAPAAPGSSPTTPPADTTKPAPEKPATP